MIGRVISWLCSGFEVVNTGCCAAAEPVCNFIKPITCLEEGRRSSVGAEREALLVGREREMARSPRR